MGEWNKPDFLADLESDLLTQSESPPEPEDDPQQEEEDDDG